MHIRSTRLIVDFESLELHLSAVFGVNNKIFDFYVFLFLLFVSFLALTLFWQDTLPMLRVYLSSLNDSAVEVGNDDDII